MAPLNEKIITGRKFRKLLDKKNKLWLRISFWTKASDVEFDDGAVLEEKFNTITNNVNNIANSINMVNDKLGGYTICVMTLDQYNALTSKDNNTIYLCT